MNEQNIELNAKIMQLFKQIIDEAKKENPDLSYLSMSFTGGDYFNVNNAYWDKESSEYLQPINFHFYYDEMKVIMP